MAFLSSYKALLFDVDNTLVSKRVLSEELPPLLSQLYQQGYRIGVCTGRSFPALKNYILPHFPQDAVHVVNGGSQVVTSTGEVKWQQLIPASLAQSLCDDAKSAGAQLYFVAKNDALYATPPYAKNLAKHPWNIAVHPIEELQNWDAALINVLDVDDEIRMAISKYLSEVIIKEMPYHENKTYFDITAQGVTKAVGIQQWCELTGILPTQIIGFGDSSNDLEFLGAVGYGVVMGNGTDEAKAVADRVIGPIEENGLATYLSELLKGQPL